jgi:hypothetical protein
MIYKHYSKKGRTKNMQKTKTAQIRAVTYFHLEPMAGFEPATC